MSTYLGLLNEDTEIFLKGDATVRAIVFQFTVIGGC